MRLLESNATDQSKLLDEVISLLKEVKEAWVAIPQSYRDTSRGPATSAVMAPGAR
jgi:flagellin-specific chaperone FliS